MQMVYGGGPNQHSLIRIWFKQHIHTYVHVLNLAHGVLNNDRKNHMCIFFFDNALHITCRLLSQLNVNNLCYWISITKTNGQIVMQSYVSFYPGCELVVVFFSLGSSIHIININGTNVIILSLSRFIVQPFTAQKNFPSEEESVKLKKYWNK